MATAVAPHVRNALVGRWLAFDVLDRVRPELGVAGPGGVARALEDAVSQRTRYSLERLDSRPLGQYLAWLSDALKAALDYLADVNRAALDRYFQMVSDRIDELVTRDYDPLQQLCETVLDAALAAYRMVGVHPPQGIVDAAEFALIHVNNRPDYCFKPMAGTLTTVARPESRACSKVEIRLTLDEFDPLSFNSLPYAIFHECICHVLQGPWTDSRQLPDAAALFSEGWMDYATYLLFDLLLRGGLLRLEVSDSVFPLLRRPDYIQAAAFLHAARRADSVHDRAWAYRSMGAQAAEWLVYRLRRLPFVGASAEELFLALSFTINGSDLSLADREDLAHIFRYGLQNAEALADLTPILRSFAKTRDVRALLAAVWTAGASWTKTRSGATWTNAAATQVTGADSSFLYSF